jgi:mono/diheme cytochrome c family protein
MGCTRVLRVAGMIVAGGTVLGLPACAPERAPESGPPEQPAAANVILASAMVNMPAGLAAADLPDPSGRGAQLTAQYCGQACHGIPAPSAHSSTDWPVVLRRMWLRMSSLDTAYQVAVPTSAERIVILDYMLANALQVTAGLLPEAPGRLLFAQKCGSCHGLPDPSQHSPDDWVAVVRRMNGRMQDLLGRTLSQDELQRIVLYLEAASRS